jgi:hypothetical protein
MKWVLILGIYMAPPTAVDWDGPWNLGMTKMVEDRQFNSEADCRTFAVQMIGQLHQGMLAPMRYQCVPLPSSLPKGAAR